MSKQVFTCLVGLLLFFSFQTVSGQSCLLLDYPFTGNSRDYSGNGYHGINYGPTVTAGEDGIPGTAYRFNGLSSFIRANGGTRIIRSREFTIFTRVYVTGKPGFGGPGSSPSAWSNMVFLQRGNSTAAGRSIIKFSMENSTGNIVLGVRDQTHSSQSVVGTPAMPYNQWFTCAGVLGPDDTLRLYIDGVEVSKAHSVQTGDFDVGIDHCVIGMNIHSGVDQAYFNGNIDELRIFDCALSPAQIDSLINPVESCDHLDLTFTGNAIDSSSNSFSTNLLGGVTPASGKHSIPNTAYQFDGVDDYINLNGNRQLITNNEFTIFTCAKVIGPPGDAGTALGNSNMLFLQRGDDNLIGESRVGLSAEDTTGNISFFIRDELNSSQSRIDFPRLTYGDWHAYAAVLGPDDTMRLYIDGVEVSSGYSMQTGYFHSQIDHVKIGANAFWGSLQGHFNGVIDEVKIFDCAFDPTQIDSLSGGILTSGFGGKVLKKHLDIHSNADGSRIIFSDWNAETGLRVEILDMNGRLVFEGKASADFDTHELRKGIYTLRVRESDGSSRQYLKFARL